MRFFLSLFLLALVACSPSKERNFQTDGAIVNGENALESGRYINSIVSLWYPDTYNECTGTIISENIVLTAGHCYSDFQPKVCFSHRTARELSLAGELDKYCIQAESSFEHNKYTELYEAPGYNTYDIRVISFRGNLPKGVTSMPLVSADFKPMLNEKITLAGFGKAKMQPETNSLFLRIADLKYTGSWSETELFVAPVNGKEACHGDSGGPIFIEKNGKQILIGIVSRGTTPESGDTCKGGFIATDLRPFLTWIKDASAKLISELPKQGGTL